MNKSVLIFLALLVTYFIFFRGDLALEDMPPVVADALTQREKSYEIDDLYDSRTKFKDLAEMGSYTIVEVYTNHCSICKKLDAKLPSLLRERGDFVIRRVRLFSGSISFTNLQEQQEWQAKQAAMREFYNYYGTPHIEIYDANGDAIEIDEGRDKSGLNTLKGWLNWEA